MLLFPHQALDCPSNSSYSVCVSSCPETCLGVVGPPGCEDKCVEGCECNPGFILSNDKCVTLRDCGCVDPSGSYHPVSGNNNVLGILGKKNVITSCLLFHEVSRLHAHTHSSNTWHKRQVYSLKKIYISTNSIFQFIITLYPVTESYHLAGIRLFS